MSEWVCSRCLVKTVCQEKCPELKSQLEREMAIEITSFGSDRYEFVVRGKVVRGPLFKREMSLSLGVLNVTSISDKYQQFKLSTVSKSR